MEGAFVTVYCNNVVEAGSVVLFFPYRDCAFDSEGFFKRVYGVRCDGCLVSPCDLGIGVVYNRVVVFGSRWKSVFIPYKVGFWRAPALQNLRKRAYTHCARLRGFWGVPPLLSNITQLNRELCCVNISWCVYRDSMCLLKWFASVNGCAGGGVRDFFVYLALTHGVFVHKLRYGAYIRNPVKNERLLLFEGYISLANETLISSGSELLAVIGVLDIDRYEIDPKTNPTFVFSAESQLSERCVQRALNEFVLDCSALRCVKFRKLNFRVKHLFVNAACISFDALLTCVGFLKRLGISVLFFNAIAFLSLPIWRLDLTKVVNAECFLGGYFGRVKLSSIRVDKRARRLTAGVHTNLGALMIVRRYLSSFGLRELKTSGFLVGTNALWFKSLHCVWVYNLGFELCVKCSAIPNLVSYCSKHCLMGLGAYEFGKLNVNSKCFDALCVLGQFYIFSHLFYSLCLSLSPLVVECVDGSWQVTSARLGAVCDCGELPRWVCFHTLYNSVFYFEIPSCYVGALTTQQPCALDVVFKTPLDLNFNKFARDLQRFVSAIFCVRVIVHIRLSLWALTVLRLMCVVSDFVLFRKLCSVLFGFIEANFGELLWKC
ncbi:hypothetical protein AADW59_00235 [Candidatus Hodgkinia cicadicola]